jgi:hypothetical protein
MADSTSLTKNKLLAQMDEGWKTFNVYLGTLTEKQLSVPTDAAGWTAKDHVMHLAAWENGIVAVMEGRNRYEGMGVDAATWGRWNVDEINAVIQQLHQHLSYAEVLKRLNDVHDELVGKVQAATEEALARSFRAYQPDTNYDGTLADRILANTTRHYEEHTPWIAAIVAEG